MVIKVEIPKQDSLTAEKTSAGWKITAIGCSDLLSQLRALSKTQKNPEKWPLPEGDSHVDLFLREFILKTRGQWKLPYNEVELCHCRNIATSVVDRAIVNGAHTGVEVSRQTSASTGCGTCRATVEKLIDYRCGHVLSARKKAS